MGIGKVEDSKEKEHGIEEVAWTRRQLIYWKNYNLTSSHHCGSWQVTAALLHLSSWISAQTILASGDTQSPSICVHRSYSSWDFNKRHCRQQCSLPCLEICKSGCKSCGDWEDAIQGTKCKARTREPRAEFMTLSHLLLLWVLPCMLSFPVWAGSLESTRKA